jgi:hypothetical protein
MPMPSFVFTASAIFSVPGGLLDAWTGREKVQSLGLGFITVAVGVPTLKNLKPPRRSFFEPMKVCRR